MKFSVQTFDVLDSTNRTAHELAREGTPEGTVVVADRQRQGRGRFGRSFFSPAGSGLYMSVVLRPTFSPQQTLFITTAAAVAVARAAEALTGEEMQIKWVNDVYYRGKKVAGILTEGAMNGDKLAYAILGIGVNIAPPKDGFPLDIQNKAGALFDAPRDVRDSLCERILTYFDAYYSVLEQKLFLEDYRRRSLLDGKTVQLLTADGTPAETASVLGIDDECGLIVQTETGVRHLTSGDVSIQL